MIPSQIASQNAANFIHVSDATTANAMRADLIQKVFNAATISAPNAATYHSTFNPTGTIWATATNVASIEEWRVTTSRGFVSRLYRFIPTTYRNPTTGKAGVIVAAGHGEIGTYDPYGIGIRYLLSVGYEVWTVDMPASPATLNVPPVVVDDPVVGVVQIRHHDDMQVLKTTNYNPLRVFMEPIAAIVDNMASRGVTNVGMFGLSGGGWTVTLYAALDTRILAAYSVAGSMPIYARSWTAPHNSIGDWEQREIPALGADYTDLYILAAQNRRFVNIHNVYDPVCFGGYAASHYTSAINTVMTTVGGSYDAVFDTTATTHTITAWSHNWIWTDLATRF